MWITTNLNYFCKMSVNHYDYIVIGSGFGGSVAAMRLSEKGYKVLVIEKGKRWTSRDFPNSNWNVKKSLWVPWLCWFGILQLKFFKKVFVLSGIGLGGGSLVYANVHMTPEEDFFTDPSWARFGHWKDTLKPFYDRARFMLGSTLYEKEYVEDLAFKEVADEMGVGSSYRPVDAVGVYFGTSHEERDPYFNGLGPNRSPCKECAGCMVGCKHNAKNTLDKNYLWFAENLFGTKIQTEELVYRIEPVISGGYQLTTHSSTSWIKTKKHYTAKGIICSAGVLGTMQLLFDQKLKFGTMPGISDQLGSGILTNCEMISGVTASPHRLNHGLAISRIMKPDTNTFVELCKYPDHSGAMFKLAVMAAGEGSILMRIFKMFYAAITHPLDWIRSMLQWNVARHSIIFLVMQRLPGSLKMNAQMAWGRVRLSLGSTTGSQIPVFIKQGQEALLRYAKKVKGVPQNAATEVLFGMSTTAHLMGGCPMGKEVSEGVIGVNGQLLGYPDFYVLDASVIQANLGVNPSLTIVAWSEYVMDLIPVKDGFDMQSLERRINSQKEKPDS